MSEENRAEKSAESTLVGILRMYDEYHDPCMTESGRESIEEEVQESPISVEVRVSGWLNPGDEIRPDEYRVLLGWGGPAVQVTGDLSAHGEPLTASLQYQDWGTPWMSLPTTTEEDEALLWFVSMFYYGS